MSNQEENTERRIVEVPSSALLIRDELEKSPIISEMVSAALVVASETSLANISPEELIRIGKSFHLKDGPGATDSNIKAFSFFYQAAESGNAEAEWLVYECIRKGDGVSFDYPISIQWLKKAANSGCLDAMYRYAIYNLLGEKGSPDWKEAISTLIFAADKNHPPSQNALGVIYISTDLMGFESEIRQSFKSGYNGNLIDAWYSAKEIDYFIQNAESDPKDAGFFLGRLYYLGLLDSEDIYTKRRHLIELAANLNCTYAQLTIAHMYALQDGITDRVLSQEERREIPKKWHERAATLGNIEAKNILGIEKITKLSSEMRKQLNDEGMLFLKKASDNNYPLGLYNYGRYSNSQAFKPTSQVDSEALLWQAANLGVARAWFCLANLSNSEIQKINHLIMGAFKGNDDCITSLASAYSWIKEYNNKVESLEYIYSLSLISDCPKFKKLVLLLKEERNSLFGIDANTCKEIKKRVFG